MEQSHQSTLKDRLLKLPLLIVVGIIGSLILYAVIPSALERNLNIDPSDTFEWSIYNSPDSSFSILLPVRPGVESYTVPINNNETMFVKLYTAEIEGEYLFTINVADLPQSLVIDDTETALLDTLDGMIKSHQDNKIEDYEIFSLGNLPAVRFVIGGKASTYWNRGVVVIDGNRKYIAQFYNDGAFDEETYNRFVNSFKIYK